MRTLILAAIVFSMCCLCGNKKQETHKNVQPENKLVDIDGNVYDIVKIGNQTWAAENLRVTKLNDGTPINEIQDNETWGNAITGNSTTPSYCFNSETIEDTIFRKKCGALYNWFTINTGNLAPKGWHVPTDAEWDSMAIYLIKNGFSSDKNQTIDKYTIFNATIGKAVASKEYWYSEPGLDSGAVGFDPSTNNSTGFSGIPSGSRLASGNFDQASAAWWCSDQSDPRNVPIRTLGFSGTALDRSYSDKFAGLAVRLIKDR
jgi:uncharacterized protein (TIGR02145 family)